MVTSVALGGDEGVGAAEEFRVEFEEGDDDGVEEVEAEKEEEGKLPSFKRICCLDNPPPPPSIPPASLNRCAMAPQQYPKAVTSRESRAARRAGARDSE